MQRRNIGAFGMATLHRLIELLRIAEQHDAGRRLRYRQHIGKRHLRRFIDKQHVDGLRGIGRCPEPGRAARHMRLVSYCIQQFSIVCRQIASRG